MTKQHDPKTIDKIKRLHSRISVIAGVGMGIILSIYFFTFGMLIDSGRSALLWAEIVTTVLFVFGLIYLKKLSFAVTRVLLSTNADCRAAFKGLKVAELEKI